MTDTMQRDEYLPDSPYPGINPFSYAHRDVFFAREAEVRALTRLIVMYRGVLLYSDSGTGKSSLINAGVIPLSMTEGFQPERVRVQPKRDEEIIVERASERVEGGPPFLPSIFTSDKELERVILSVEDFLERLSNRAVGVYPLMIFDQFEEWVTLFEEDSAGQMAEEATTAQERIRDAIVSLVNDTELPVKVLIVFRQDYLAKIDPLIEQCPRLRDHYFRLTALSGDQIYRAIRGPFEKFPEEYRPELSDPMAKEIQTQFGERSEGTDVHLTEVQIVCQSLFEAGRRGEDIDQYFSDEGGVQGILERYLEEALESLEEDQQEPAIGLLSRMVTSAGTRNVISRNDLLSRVENEDGIPRELLNEALANLDEKAKLVRRERRREVYYYEIVSEFLVGWIRRKAQEWQRLLEQRERDRQRQEELEQARQQAEEERRRADEQARYVRIFRWLTAALVVVVLLALGTAGFAIFQRQEAKDALEKMVIAEGKAVAAEKKVERLQNQLELAQQKVKKLQPQLKLAKKEELEIIGALEDSKKRIKELEFQNEEQLKIAERAQIEAVEVKEKVEKLQNQLKLAREKELEIIRALEDSKKRIEELEFQNEEQLKRSLEYTSKKIREQKIADKEAIGTILELKGHVLVSGATAELGMLLYVGDVIKTGLKPSHALIEVKYSGNKVRFRITEDSEAAIRMESIIVIKGSFEIQGDGDNFNIFKTSYINVYSEG